MELLQHGAGCADQRSEGIKYMQYQIVIPEGRRQELRDHLLRDRGREQMAILLCGVAKSAKKIRLLVRHVVQLKEDAFEVQTAGGLKPKAEAQSAILRMAAAE